MIIVSLFILLALIGLFVALWAVAVIAKNNKDLSEKNFPVPPSNKFEEAAQWVEETIQKALNS